MFKLSLGDFGRGLIIAVLAPLFVAITTVLGAVINVPGFDVRLVDYSSVFFNLINTSIVVSYGAFTGYILKNLLTGDSGKFLQK